MSMRSAIINRASYDQEYLDVFNLTTNKITYSQCISPDASVIERKFSPNSKYFIEYEQQSSTEDKVLTLNTTRAAHTVANRSCVSSRRELPEKTRGSTQYLQMGGRVPLHA